MSLIYSDWGLANRIGNDIVLNKQLLKPEWKQLHDQLLAHESGHNDHPIHNLNHDVDSVIDSSPPELVTKIMFMIRHPKSLVQMSPVWFYQGRPYFDLSLILLYLCVGAIIYFNWILR